MVERLLEVGPEAVGEASAAWRSGDALWGALRLEERLRALDDGDEDHVPPGLSRSHLDDLLAEAPDDIRFHLSRGAAESFANTAAAAAPARVSAGAGHLRDVDGRVPRRASRGPGKLDGSFVTWVNGALLRAVGARAGYDVHFAPFRYRPGSKTRILYTTQRD